MENILKTHIMLQNSLHKIILKHRKPTEFKKYCKLYIITSNLKLQSYASNQQYVKFGQCMIPMHEKDRMLQLVGNSYNSEIAKRKMRYQSDFPALHNVMSDWHHILSLTSITNLAVNTSSIKNHLSFNLLTIPFTAAIQFSTTNCQITVVNNSKRSYLLLNLKKYSWTSCCLVKNKKYNQHEVCVNCEFIKLLCTSHKDNVRTWLCNQLSSAPELHYQLSWWAKKCERRVYGQLSITKNKRTYCIC